MVTKTKKAGLIHLWWFVAILFVAIVAMAFLSLYKTHKIIDQANTNQLQMAETFRYLRAEPEWKLMTDSLGRHYVDSIRVFSTEQAQRMETLLIKNATDRLTEYSETLVKETQSLNNTLILWATVLTLLSIIFTFLGFMELRDRFSAVEEKRREMDDVIEKAAREVDDKIRDAYNALSGVQHKREEMDVVLMKAQNAISTITDRFEDLSVSAIDDIDEKIKEIDSLKQEMKENERISFYNLNMQSVLLKSSEEEKLQAFKSLTEIINKDPLVSVEKKYVLLADLFVSIAKNLEKNQQYETAVDYYTKALNLNPSCALYILRGIVFCEIDDWAKAKDDFSKAIELDTTCATAYKYRGDYYKHSGNTKAAIEDYSTVIKLDPEYLEAYSNRADVYMEEQEYDKALTDYNAILNRNPLCMKTYCKRGMAYKSLNMIEEALDDFEKCIESDIEDQHEIKLIAQQEINKIKEIE